MDSESERIFERMQLHRLIDLHPDWTNQHLADELGKSEGWVRKWRDRLLNTPHPKFKMYLSQSRAPKTFWRETPTEVKTIIGDMRVELSEQYHRKAGPKLILHELRKREDLRDADYYVPNSERTVAKILREMGYVVPKCHRERQPLVLPAPNEEWEMDFGQIRIDEATIFEFFLVVDRGTSRVVYLEGSTGYNAETALEAVARLLLVHGLPKRLRFDRDSRFVGSWTRDSYPSPLIRFLRVVNVEPVVCPPYRPDKKPFVERTIKTLKREWLAKFSPATLAEAYEVLPGFVHYHNAQRVHQGRACNNQIPDVAFPDLPPLPTLPETVQPNRWLEAYHGRVFRRRISSNSTIQVDRYTYYIDDDYSKQQVLVHLDAKKQVFFVSCDDQVLKPVEIRGLLPETLDFQSYLVALKQEARTIEWHRHITWYKRAEDA
jgi:hypothetical protein